ncbi:MAG: ATPase [Pseudomonadota bacterium]
MNAFNRQLCVLLVLMSVVANGRAEVLHAEKTGFVVRHELRVVAPRETVWRMLLGHVAEWWDSAHTYSGDATNLYIEPRALGCFCEDLGAADAVVHLTVTAIRKESLLRLTGGLGPLGLMGVDGNMTFSFADDESGTAMAMEYRVGGYDPDGLDQIAPAVDATLGLQLERLVRLIETGSAEPLSDSPSETDEAEDSSAEVEEMATDELPESQPAEDISE